MPGLSKVDVLNSYIADKSYIEGYQPSQADAVVFEAHKAAPAPKYVYAHRWYKHIASFGDARKKFPGEKKPLSAYGPAGETDDVPSVQATAAADPVKVESKDEEDFDLFADDDDKVDEEAEKLKAERLKEYEAKKANKPVLIAKSSLLLDVKPWDDETNMKELEEHVREIQTDGLVWGASKLVPVAYGVKKLQIMATIEDDKVSTDWLEEQILSIESHVQSMDIAAFNKI